MTEQQRRKPSEVGAQHYQEWRAANWADPEFRAIYAEEAEKSELWLQLVEARQSLGLTQAQMAERLGISQAQVSRLEKRGYDAYTLSSLRKYVAALGEGYELIVKIRTPDPSK